MKVAVFLTVTLLLIVSTPSEGGAILAAAWEKMVDNNREQYMTTTIPRTWGGGCHLNNCWAECGIPNTGFWCYTKTHYKDDLVSCKEKKNCDTSWRCHSVCQLGLEDEVSFRKTLRFHPQDSAFLSPGP
jgi:hypothetical protein